LIQQTSLREIRTSPDPAREIAVLVQTQKLVPIPGIGYIKASIQAASFDQIQGLLVPPGKKLSFEACPHPDNTLLIKHLCQKFNLDTHTVQLLLDSFENRLRDQLQRQQSFAPITGLGRFYKDYKGTILFFPEGMSQDKQSTGLPPVNIQPFVQIPSGKSGDMQRAPATKAIKPTALISYASALTLLAALTGMLMAAPGTNTSNKGGKNFTETVPASISVDLADQDGSAFREVGTHDDDLLPLTIINGYSDGIR
jgi:hypothetical protein